MAYVGNRTINMTLVMLFLVGNKYFITHGNRNILLFIALHNARSPGHIHQLLLRFRAVLVFVDCSYFHLHWRRMQLKVDMVMETMYVVKDSLDGATAKSSANGLVGRLLGSAN